jgi:hypothetical protein
MNEMLNEMLNKMLDEMSNNMLKEMLSEIERCEKWYVFIIISPSSKQCCIV